MVRPVCDSTEDEILAVPANGESDTLTKIIPLKHLPYDIHINKYSMENILSLKDLSSVTGVYITMDPSK